MNERDELALELFIADNSRQARARSIVDFERLGGETYAHRLADAALAAGYRKHRIITTIEELDALPAGTIIRDPLSCIKWGSGEWGTFSGNSVSSSRIDFPATVMHEPDPTA